MKQSRFTEEQMVRILAEGDKGEKTVVQICREHGISQATYYNWRKRFRGMGVDEVKEYRQLKRENARLKKLLADREVEIDSLQEVVRKKL
jgi:putative transposase